MNQSFWKSHLPSLLLVAADVVGFALCWTLAYKLRALMEPLLGPLNEIDPYWKIMPVIVAVGVINAGLFGLYRTRRRLSSLASWGALLKVGYHYALYMMVVGYFVREFELGRLVILFATVFSFLWLVLSRQTFRAIKSAAYKRGQGLVRAAIVGTGELASQVEENLRHHPEIGFELLGFISHPEEPGGAIPSDRLLGSAQETADLVRQNGIEELFVAIPQLSQHEQLNLINLGRNPGLRIQLVSDLFGVIASRAKVDEINAFPVITLRDGHLPRPHAAAKRLLDLAVAGFGCFVWLLFFHWWISLWIRRDSPGPVFFTQQRVGRDGRLFTIYKYRTMSTQAKQYEVAPTSTEDPRVTRAGAWLRKTSLDELPQLWNVLRGDMSMVGPRPEMPFIVEQYQEWEKRRLDVKPGITGLWQVIGRKNLPLHLNMQYDFYYISNQSILLDLEILIRTVPAVIYGRGAF
ncbi:MAG: sugar transferase [Candidatus Sumerlaeia bacterium]|nr:sugar transferase [Candidatus Sumerlaeia bacterium]